MTAVFKNSTSKGAARLVLLALADEASDEGFVLAYRRSQRWLAKKANTTEGTCRAVIQTLIASGELVLLRPGNGRTQADYRILVEGIEGVEIPPPGGSGSQPRGSEIDGQGVGDQSPIIPLVPGTSRSDPIHAASLPGFEAEARANTERAREDQQRQATSQNARAADGFEEFWLAYPRKTAKGAARAAWPKARKLADLATILEGVQRYIASDPQRPTKFTAHPAKWLKDERWGDQRETATRGQPMGPGKPVDAAWDRSAPSGVVSKEAIPR